MWYGMVWYMVWYGIWYGMVWYGMLWCGMLWYGMVWYGMVWYGMVWYGMVWYGMVWYGMVWYGMVWYGMVWLFVTSRYELVVINLLTTCYVQTISDLLEQLVANLLASSILLQDDNNLFQTCQQLGTSSANTSC